MQKSRRVRGTIARLTPNGYGFVMPEDQELDPGRRGIFFHAQDLEMGPGGFSGLKAGELVEFEIVDTNKGKRCVGVKPLRESLAAEPAAAPAPEFKLKAPKSMKRRPDGTMGDPRSGKGGF